MGLLLRALALLIASLLLAVGVGGAAYVGTDDRVWLDAVEVDSKPGQVVVTSPELTSYRQLHLLVRASAPGGVFLATGNPVDIRDLAAQVDHYELTGIRRTDVLGGQRQASAEDPVKLPQPTSLSDWYDHADGEGRQELPLDLDGTPTQLYLQPMAKQVPTVQFGARFDGLFLALLGVAAVGALLLALTVWWMSRARRARRSQPGVSGADTATGADDARPDGAAPTPSRGLTVSLVAVGLAASGCSWVPQEVEPTTPTKVSLAADDLEPMLAAYDERHSRARTAANPPSHSALPWRKVDSGPAYDDDVYDTRLHAALELKPIERLTHKPITTYSPRFESYPLWTVTVSDTAGGWPRGEQPTKEQRKERRERVSLDLFERGSAASPWLRRLTASIPEKDLPEPAAVPMPADEGDRRAANRAIAATMAYLRGDGPPDGVEVDELAKDFRATSMRLSGRDLKYFTRASLETMPLADQADSLRMVAVDGGQLAIGVRKARHNLHTRPSRDMTWTSQYGAVNGHTSDRLFSEMYFVIVVLLPDGGSTPRVLSTSTLRDIS